MKNLKFNRWTIIEDAGKNKWGTLLVKCRCECGNIRISNFSDIKSNRSIQCRDCGYKLRRNNIPILKSPLSGKGNNYKHGMYGTRTYKAWIGMVYRCNKTKGKDYKWYGSRGITVCEEWLKFQNFYKDMGEKPPKMYLDRINNDLGYFKENCRWVNSIINSQNRRCVREKI